MATSIRLINPRNTSELRAIGELRYRVTVEEMCLRMRYANHHNKSVIEPLDYTGHVFEACINGKTIGTVRVNLVREADVGEYFKAYGIAALPASSSERVSVTTRLAVDRKFRNSRVPLRLAQSAYRLINDHRITHDVIDSRPNLVPFFRKLGYRTHCGNWGHPEFGDVVVQYLAINEPTYLRRVSLDHPGSPESQKRNQLTSEAVS